MWLRVKIAIRNAFRNRRRSVLSVLMIASAVASIVIFEGFTYNMVEGLRETTIETQTGHVQLARQSYWEKTNLKPKHNLISNYRQFILEAEKDSRVKYATGRLEFFGLLSKEDASISARAVTIDPSKEVSRNQYFRFKEGGALTSGNGFQVAIGSGLAKKLGIKTKDSVSLLTHTYDGVVNAMDLEVSGIFQTDISEFDDSTLLISLSTAQKLLDTEGVEQIVFGLNSSWDTKQFRDDLAPKLAGLSEDIQLKTWFQLASLYKQVAMFNKLQNIIVKFILFSLVLLSIANTVGMSIMERTGEIGTIRALGEQRKSVVWQFLTEGFFLGLCGALLGGLGGSLLAYLFNSMNIPVVFPGASSPIIIKIQVLGSSIFKGGGLGVMITVLAAVLPAYRAAKMNIVQALRHNI
ncbi:ABC transporter permease [bacterium]|nr:ABC transporter permease [bacterium]